MCDETLTRRPMTYEAEPNSSSNILKCDRKLVKVSAYLCIHALRINLKY